jgi:hypothetical protein
VDEVDEEVVVVVVVEEEEEEEEERQGAGYSLVRGAFEMSA